MFVFFLKTAVLHKEMRNSSLNTQYIPKSTMVSSLFNHTLTSKNNKTVFSVSAKDVNLYVSVMPWLPRDSISCFIYIPDHLLLSNIPFPVPWINLNYPFATMDFETITTFSFHSQKHLTCYMWNLWFVAMHFNTSVIIVCL